nr:hypothetical protein CFP56_31788 [Quercus suber]
MVLTEYTYVFAIGTFFALLDAFNNGASTSSCDFDSLGSILTVDFQTMLPTHGLRVFRRDRSPIDGTCMSSSDLPVLGYTDLLT